MTVRERMHVVAGALIDGAGRVLIQRRADDAHQGGLWEFPGGKLQPGEARRDGLARELREELGIETLDARPLIAVEHDYADRQVRLDVWEVTRWRGDPAGREGQPIEWAAPRDLEKRDFPAADRPVLRALALSPRCLVTPPPGPDTAAWIDALTAAAAGGIGLVQIRAPSMEPRVLGRLAARAIEQLRAASPTTRVVVNGDASLAEDCGADGVHFDSTRLWQRPRPGAGLLGASCHDAADLARAGALGADFALLGPVAPTATHPGAVPLGWRAFESLVARAALPVYALGGLGDADLARARAAGARGVAAMRGYWKRTAMRR